MQGPERALIRGAFHHHRGKHGPVAQVRKVAVDILGPTRRDQLLKNQRLNLSRKALTDRSSEVTVVKDFNSRIRIAEHIALRANPLVLANDLLRQDNKLLLCAVVRRSVNLLIRLRFLGLSLIGSRLFDLSMFSRCLGLLLKLGRLIGNRDICVLLLFLP